MRYKTLIMTSSDANLLVQVNILNCMEQLDSFVSWMLKCLTSGDEAHAAGAFVDDRGSYGLGKVAGAGRGTARIDQADSTHVAVGHLITAKVDRMIAR